jgi:hypothetical protein
MLAPLASHPVTLVLGRATSHHIWTGKSSAPKLLRPTCSPSAALTWTMARGEACAPAGSPAFLFFEIKTPQSDDPISHVM